MINPLSSSFQSLINFNSDYNKRLQELTKFFTDTVEKIDDQVILPYNFLDLYRSYPRYPYDFRVIKNLKKYNIITIFNSAQDDIEHLLSGITNKDILNLKTRMDKLPTKRIAEDFALQNAFFANVTDDLFEKPMLYGLITDTQLRSYLFKTFGHVGGKTISMETKDTSFTFLYAIYLLLTKNFTTSMRIFEKSYQYLIPIVELQNDKFLAALHKYFDENIDFITESITRFILSYTYNITNPSGSFLKGVLDFIKPKIIEMKNVFMIFFKDRDIISVECSYFITLIFYSLMSNEFVNYVTPMQNDVVNRDLIQALKDEEIRKFDEIFKDYSGYAFKQYLYLVYYYKMYPQKFLNVLQLVLGAFSKQTLLKDFDSINHSEIHGNLMQLFGTMATGPAAGLKFKKIEELLNLFFTQDKLKELLLDNQVVEFGFRLRMIEYFEEFFNSTAPYITTYFDSLFSAFFDYLNNTVQVNPYKEYFFNRKMLLWYTAAFFKKEILENKIFSKQEILMQQAFLNIITNPGFKPNFDIEKMRVRIVQFFAGNIVNITTLFQNVFNTAVDKQLHNENITYFLN